jgi:general secretion pathway protein K
MAGIDNKKRGAALLTVLLLVAVMSVVATGIANEMRVALARAANVGMTDQSLWHVRSAEIFAGDALRQLRETTEPPHLLPESWTRDGLVFPLIDGTLSARLSDVGRCFNVNMLVSSSEAGGFVPNLEALEEFVSLLGRFGIAAAEAGRLGGSLASFMSLQAGADASYLNESPPYRASGTMLAHIGELARVEGWDRGTREALGSILCALPMSAPIPLNVNALKPEHAALLANVLGPSVATQTAVTLIENRPAAGYATLEEFLMRLPGSVAVDRPTLSARLGFSFEVVLLETVVSRNGQTTTARSVLRTVSGRDTTLWQRQLGESW